jgi:hypothetical protein
MCYVSNIQAAFFQVPDDVLENKSQLLSHLVQCRREGRKVLRYLGTETISHARQLLELQIVFEMIDNNISNRIHSCRGMTSKPLRQIHFPAKEGIRVQRMPIKEIGNDSQVALSGKVVCN